MVEPFSAAFSESKSFRQGVLEGARELVSAWEAFLNIARIVENKAIVLADSGLSVWACNGTALDWAGCEDKHEIDLQSLIMGKSYLDLRVGHCKIFIIGHERVKVPA
jgi:hypothetical protein